MVELNRKRNNDAAISSQEKLIVKKQRFDSIVKEVAVLFNLNTSGSDIRITSDKQVLLLGRSSHCDIKFDSPDVSSKHCSIEITQIYTASVIRYNLTITDLSSNGTFINSVLLGRGNTHLLKSGDEITIAQSGNKYIFRYLSEVKGKNSNYIIGKKLGSGHYADVKEAINRVTGEVVAIKIFHPNNKNDYLKELKQELQVLMSISHPNIVKFHDTFTESLDNYTQTTCLVLEKVNGGELFQRIVDKQKLRENETIALFKQLLQGLGYLHSRNIIHRDLKPENILLEIKPRRSLSETQSGPWDSNELDVQVKIADFGLAKFIGEFNFTNTLCGTPAYVAPEVLQKTRKYNKAVDLWSLGVLLYVCLCGFPPFSEELGPPSMRQQILSGKFAFFSPYWDPISDFALDLITRLLVVDPTKRLDVNQTANHIWFTENKNENKISEATRQLSVTRLTKKDTVPLTLKERVETAMAIDNVEKDNNK
ncbi:hypothetical protein PACTADRAFT_32833 [Pachysolen tannophilus NRRL Y-2460]|uniref:DNA damage response protein kinase DUN1 n=1 Tax=Pachysolen tannophilus NRRL Y-2460 TaxID=669874 RepID=A0A1E4U033_PACTA|nr:hypothetical protein PACTADRAFT_32833 [Pachysolen tannophilus NRRL Y-2460]